MRKFRNDGLREDAGTDPSGPELDAELSGLPRCPYISRPREELARIRDTLLAHA